MTCSEELSVEVEHDLREERNSRKRGMGMIGGTDEKEMEWNYFSIYFREIFSHKFEIPPSLAQAVS